MVEYSYVTVNTELESVEIDLFYVFKKILKLKVVETKKLIITNLLFQLFTLNNKL